MVRERPVKPSPQAIVGSNPTSYTIIGIVTQLVEWQIEAQKVTSSNLVDSTKFNR